MTKSAPIAGVCVAVALAIVTVAGCGAAGGRSHDGRPEQGPPAASVHDQASHGGGHHGDVQKDPGPSPNKATAPGIAVSPEFLTLGCPGETCGQPVTIRNTGGVAVRIGIIYFTDETDSNFTFGHDCMNQHLVPGEECTFRIGWYGPSGDQATVYTANLVITSDAPGVRAFVGVTRLPTGPIVGS